MSNIKWRLYTMLSDDDDTARHYYMSKMGSDDLEHCCSPLSVIRVTKGWAIVSSMYPARALCRKSSRSQWLPDGKKFQYLRQAKDMVAVLYKINPEYQDD